MKILSNSIVRSVAVAMLVLGGSAQAAEFILDSAEEGDARQRGQLRSKVVLVGFSGNADITDAQVDVNYNPELVSVSVKALGAAGCSNPKPGLIRVVSPDLGGKALGDKVGAYCQVTVRSLKGPLAPDALKAANAFCSGTGGVQKACDSEVGVAK
jgi:hypothetical protein